MFTHGCRTETPETPERGNKTRLKGARSSGTEMSGLEQPFGCMETSPAGGRLGIRCFSNGTKAHHISHWAEALLCNNIPCPLPPPINSAQIQVTVPLKRMFIYAGYSWWSILRFFTFKFESSVPSSVLILLKHFSL